MVHIEYRLIDTGNRERDFHTVSRAVEWIMGIGESIFESVMLTDSSDNYVDGFSEILRVYDINQDMYGGNESCIHANAKRMPRGGVVCPDCKAWFCY